MIFSSLDLESMVQALRNRLGKADDTKNSGFETTLKLKGTKSVDDVRMVSILKRLPFVAKNRRHLNSQKLHERCSRTCHR